MKLNNKEYKIPEITFNTICDLEEMGVDLSGINKKALSTVRGFLALAVGGDLEEAGRILEEHLVNGGGLEEVLREIEEALVKSGFFLALAQKAGA